MANALLTTDKIADRALMAFSEKATFLKTINREYSDEFANKTAKIGDEIRVPIPQHAQIRSGRVMQPAPLVTNVRPVTIIDQTGFDLTYNSSELALDIEEFERRYLSQQIDDLVVNIEAQVQDMAYASTFNQTGNAATALVDLQYANVAKKLIEDQGGHKGTKRMLLNSAGEATLIPALAGLFNAQRQIEVQYEEGEMGRAAGFDWNSSTVSPLHVNGAGTGYLVAGASQSGSSLAVDTGTGALTKGTVFTIAGLNAVHPQTKVDLGYLMRFVVTEDYAGGAGNVSIYPAIITDGSEKNVTGAPADNAALTIDGAASTAYGINLAYTRDAFTFATVDLPEYPDRPCSRRVYESVSMRVATGSDMTNDSIGMRFDILWGFGALRPEWACRIMNDPSLFLPA